MKMSVYSLMSLLIWIFISAVGCQTPTLPPATHTQSLSAQAKISIPEAAQKLMRPGTQDRFEWVPQTGRPDTWIVLHDPPIKATPSPLSTTAQTFNTQWFVSLPGKLPYEGTHMCSVASFQQPANIDYQQYASWYGRSISGDGGYGTRRNHPDRWVQDESCRGVYTISLRSGNVPGTKMSAVVRENRYAQVPAGWRPPQFLAYGPMIDYFSGINQIQIPCSAAGSFVISVNKSEACDQTSPAIPMLTFGPNPNPTNPDEEEEETQLPPPSPNERLYCPRNIQREHLDIAEQQLYALKASFAAFQSSFETDFSTQALGPEPKPYPIPTPAAYRIQQMSPHDFLPTGEPPGPETPPTYHADNTYRDRIPATEIAEQISFIWNQLSAVHTEIEAKQQALSNQNDEETSALQHQLTQFKEQALLIEKDLKQTSERYGFMCSELDSALENTPTLDLVYAGLETDGSIVLKGRVFAPPTGFELSEIQPDFGGDIELTDPNMTAMHDANLPGRFTFVIPAHKYIFSDTFMAKISSDMQASQGANPLERLQIKLTAGSFQIQSNQNKLYPSQTEYLLDNQSIWWQTNNMPYPPLENLGEWGSCHRMMYVYQRMSFLMDLIGVDTERVLAGNLPEQGLLIERSSDMKNYLAELLILRQLSQQSAENCSRLGNSAIEFGRDIPDEFSITALPALVPLSGTIALISPKIQPAIQRAITWAIASITIYTGYEAISENDNSPVALAFYRDRILTPHMLMGKDLGVFWSTNNETNELWKNILKGGQKEGLADWEVGDEAHHIIQQGVSGTAFTAINQCFTPTPPQPDEWQPSQWNRSGIHSGVNGIPLHEWFHSLLHTKVSRDNMSNYITNILNNPDSPDSCNFGSGSPCSKIENFLENKLKPYLAKLNHKYKEALKDELEKLLREQASHPEIQRIQRAINNGNPQFISNGNLEVNRIINNKSWGGKSGYQENNIGLNKAQRDALEKRMKARIDSGELKKPRYINQGGLSLDELCKEINHYMSTP
jgi:hypothetical protein